MNQINQTKEFKEMRIRQLIIDMLDNSHTAMEKKIDKVLLSGAVDIEAWDQNTNPMILPKCIIVALLQEEAEQYSARETSFEKQVRKESANIRMFI
jgi:hypothetical protein